MFETGKSALSVIDISKNSFHVVGLDRSGAIALRHKWSRGQIESRFANLPPCLVGMEDCVGCPYYLSRPCILMMEPAEEWDGRDRSGCLNGAPERGVVPEREMCTSANFNSRRKR